jgi:hypothetical protein
MVLNEPPQIAQTLRGLHGGRFSTDLLVHVMEFILWRGPDCGWRLGGERVCGEVGGENDNTTDARALFSTARVPPESMALLRGEGLTAEWARAAAAANEEAMMEEVARKFGGMAKKWNEEAAKNLAASTGVADAGVSFVEGEQVTLVDLSVLELNGMRAQVLGSLTKAGRYPVLVEEGVKKGAKITVKPEKIKRLEAAMSGAGGTRFISSDERLHAVAAAAAAGDAPPAPPAAPPAALAAGGAASSALRTPRMVLVAYALALKLDPQCLRMETHVEGATNGRRLVSNGPLSTDKTQQLHATLEKLMPATATDGADEGGCLFLHGYCKFLKSRHNQNMCERCGKLDVTSKCTKCKTVSYCSRECQSADLKEHKSMCKRVTAAAGKSAGGAGAGKSKSKKKKRR